MIHQILPNSEEDHQILTCFSQDYTAMVYLISDYFD